MCRFIAGIVVLALLLALGLLMAGCSRDEAPSSPSPQGEGSPSPVSLEPPTSAPPTATLEPLAARVNGEGISLAEYQAELAQFQAAVGRELTAEERRQVLGDLVDRTLLALGAAERDFTVDEGMLEERMGQLGNEQALADWMAANQYDEQSFRKALRRSIAATWMRDEILREAGNTAEQVHARQILVDDPDLANQLAIQIQNGADFAPLAAQYDPVTHGELGWFPRGYLPDPLIEAAAFKLEAGQASGVIQTAIGFHVVQVIEREAARPLLPDALRAVQEQVLRQWLQDRRNSSQIEILIQD